MAAVKTVSKITRPAFLKIRQFLRNHIVLLVSLFHILDPKTVEMYSKCPITCWHQMLSTVICINRGRRFGFLSIEFKVENFGGFPQSLPW